MVGLSGGIDSVTLLSIVAELREVLRMSVMAIHVNHGLSLNAERWADFCRVFCDGLDVPLVVEHADLGPWRSLGIEGAAREARYALLRKHSSDAILLAQHMNDQAETLLIQLFRGAGAAGLAAMPEVDAGQTKIIRPLLNVSRSDIVAFAQSEALSWVDDESNFDVARPRNFVRHCVLPRLESKYPGVVQRIARSASHLAEASELLGVLGRLDSHWCESDGALSIIRLRELGELRARNAIRFWTESRGFQAAPTSVAVELWRQLCDSRHDATPEVTIGGACYRRYRNHLYLDNPRRKNAESMIVRWDGSPAIPLDELGGTLLFVPSQGAGLSAAKLHSGRVTVRTRVGGERIRPDFRRPTRTLKSVLQQSGIPVWKRQSLPLLFCDETLVAVPGVADDCAWSAAAEEPGVVLVWKEELAADHLVLNAS